VLLVPQLRIGEAAALLGVSDDTVRRWADQGRVQLRKAPSGRSVVDGVELARIALELADGTPSAGGARSARNSLRGIVTKVIRDTVMAQVELQAGPHRIVSLMSREAADELALEVGVVAYASIKATNVVVGLDDVRPAP
jgi:molybdopterin-binding protein